MSRPHPVRELLGNQQLAGRTKFLPLRHKQREGGRAREGSPGGCQSRFKWRHPACSVWAGPPPPLYLPPHPPSLFLGLTGIPLLVTLFWGNRWPRPAARPQLIGRKHRLVTACVDTGVCVHLLFFLQLPFVCEQKEPLHVCAMKQQLVRTFCPIDRCETLGSTQRCMLHYSEW